MGYLMKLNRVFLLCFIVLTCWTLPAHAITLLAEDWEGTCSEVAARWADSYSASPQTEQFPCESGSTYFGTASKQPFFLDSTTKLFGANSLRYNYQGTQYDSPPQGGGYADRNFSQRSSEIWITFYNRMSAGFVTAGGLTFGQVGGIGGAATKGPYSFMISDTKCVLNNVPTNPAPCGTPGATLQQNGWVFHYMWGSRNLIMTAQGIKDAVPAYQTQNLTHNVQTFNQPDLDWVCYEAHIRLNTPGQADGLYEQYATNVTDGDPAILTTRYINRQFIDATPTGVMPSDAKWFKARTYRQDGLGQMWYDSITYSTTRIGCTGGSGGGVVDTVPPPTPPNFAATVTSGSATTLTWTGVVDNGAAGLASYNIRGCTGAACTPSATVANVGPSTTSYSNTGLTASTTYGRSIAAVDANGNTSPYSSTIYFTTSSTFSELPGTDTFTRADATNIGTLWDSGYTAQTNLQIISQRIRGVTVNTRSFETYTGTVASNNVFGQMTIAAMTGAQLADQCVHLRASNAATMTSYAGCALRNGANTWEIREYTTGTPVVLSGNATYDVVVGDKIRLEADGTTLRLYRERAGTRILVVSTTDATLASGKVGLSLFVATSGTLSNVEADDFATGAISAGVPTLITYDSTSGSSITNTTASVSWSHTVGSGSNVLVPVCAYARGTTAGNAAVLNVSVGGIPATKVRHDTETNAGVTFRSEQWYALGVPAGTHTITINWTGTNAQYAVGTAASYFGVSQTTAPDANNGSVSAFATTISTNITTIADHALIMDCVLARDAPYSVGSGQVQRIQSAAFGDSQVISDVLDKTPAGVETMDGTQPTAEDYTHSVASYKPATTVPPTPAVAPSVTSVTADLTGAAVTFGTTVPDFVRVVDDRPTPIIAPLMLFQPTATLRFSEAFTRADSGSLGSNYVTTTGAGSHSINSNRLAVTTVNTFASNAITPVLGINSGMFTINGTATFLLGVSYFDVQEYTTSDLDTLAARGFNTVRVFANWDTSNAGAPGNEFGGNRAVCDSAGALVTARRDILQTFINEAKLRNMIVDMVVLSLHDHQLLANDTARLACVSSVVNYYKTNLNVMFDIVQEHDTVVSPWTTANTAAESKTWTDAAFAACATCIIFNSATINNTNGGGDFIGPNSTATALTAFNQSNINTKLTTNSESVLAVHEARSANWASVTGARVTAYKNYLSSIGKASTPVLFDEPNRRVGASGPTGADFVTAATQARAAGAAMWIFHSDKNFDLRTQTFFQQLDSEEKAFTTSVGGSMGLNSPLDQYIQATLATYTNTNDIYAGLGVRYRRGSGGNDRGRTKGDETFNSYDLHRLRAHKTMRSRLGSIAA
jgi:hypothetical protein